MFFFPFSGKGGGGGEIGLGQSYCNTLYKSYKFNIVGNVVTWTLKPMDSFRIYMYMKKKKLLCMIL